MTTKEIKRRAELYSALAEGKTIQVKNMDGKWADVKPEKLNYIHGELVFRIKPEPKYRPFKTAEECWNEMLKHEPFGFLSKTDEHDYSNICRVFEEKGKPKIMFASNPYSDFYTTKVFDRFQFADGTPFGIKEE